MTFKPAFPEAAVEYLRQHQDEWPSVLAYKVGVLFGYTCTDQIIRKKLKELRKLEIYNTTL
jgi:hypothetical protein